ncbi:primosomal replication protein n [Lacticaseibacillus nasuensis JCM 17158]|uniref:Replication restart protein PriA n=2 Tax=Lacticaseibacillus TaxID=2759736 RepID=A0A0R1JSL1_9LACO|nr:primosomal protein N' [Lacticaseibacillus nasuensis]KRK74304.1 primosomal replication protein n [Lacticaseibacillus nasuensis JCM 17158]
MPVAKVIVDVPTMQTNRPYDYEIPTALAESVQPGMRVWVPFGHRDVAGMVVAIDAAPTFTGELKSISSVLDPAPVLNAELLALAHWLADTTYAFWISCIQTMLPTMLKVDTDKTVTAATPAGEAMLTAPEVSLTAMTDQTELAKLLRGVASGDLVVHYRRHDRAKVKTETHAVPLLTPAEYSKAAAALRANATQQRALLQTLSDWAAAGQQPAIAESQLPRAPFTAAAKRGWVRLEEREVYRDPYPELRGAKLTTPLPLTADQQPVVATVTAAVAARRAETFLLEGVTGSGKTEVYLQIIAQAIAAGRTALMLVPEIALTPQMVHRVTGRFGRQVAVLHSGLSDGEKFDEWRRIQRGEAKIVVGARSAAFAPLTNIGVFIIDEEHETSYKQDDAPRYHARDVVLHRAATFGAPVVLGSATPSLESRARAEKGVYTLLRLPERINQQPMPPVTIIDMRDAMKKSGQEDFSQELLTALQDRVARHEQSVLLLNRRGFSSFVMCRECGYVVQCPNCDISLTLHMDTHTLRCHYCGHEEPIPHRCPSCGSTKIRYYGTGTQKVEAKLNELLPEARVLRMDVDTTRKKGGHAKLLAKFGRHEADILLGTQMIAKGLDFPDVTLVGVINADTGLGLPDFRASERTFQLLTQVSGRAGRADKPGSVIIQTFNPDHYAITYAKHHDYEGFFRREMAIRHLGHYPPYYFTIKLTVSHQSAEQAAKAIYSLAKTLKAGLTPAAIVLGPTPGAIARLKNRYYYQIVVKYTREPKLAATLTQILDSTQQSGRQGFQVAIDREPQSFV